MRTPTKTTEHSFLVLTKINVTLFENHDIDTNTKVEMYNLVIWSTEKYNYLSLCTSNCHVNVFCLSIALTYQHNIIYSCYNYGYRLQWSPQLTLTRCNLDRKKWFLCFSSVATKSADQAVQIVTAVALMLLLIVSRWLAFTEAHDFNVSRKKYQWSVFFNWSNLSPRDLEEN